MNTLLPDMILTGTFQSVPLEKMLDSPDGLTTAPRTLIESIRRLGILQPVVLIEHEGAYTIAAGRKRIAAAAALQLTEVPASVWPAGWTTTEVIALTENAVRFESPAVDLAAIEALLADGATEAEICQATGLARATLKKRLKLRRLHPSLRAALDNGLISPAVADQAARHSDEIQAALAAEFAAQGRLTGKEVIQATETTREEAAGNLPLDLFATPGAEASTTDEKTAPLSEEKLDRIAAAGWAYPHQIRALVAEVRALRAKEF